MLPISHIFLLSQNDASPNVLKLHICSCFSFLHSRWSVCLLTIRNNTTQSWEIQITLNMYPLVQAPSFVFVDEIDAIAGRHARKDPRRRATFEALIAQLDGE